jgi:YidC/Oxa1 family membrane protein insertase
MPDIWNLVIIQPFTNALLFIYYMVGQNFGIAIILFTILIRLITHPLMAAQIKGSTGMQKLQTDPRYKEMQEKYKDDKEKLAQEQMKLYKDMGINPVATCLPTLIQFPLIIGLYQSLYKAMANTPLDMLNLSRHLYPFIDINRIIPINNSFLWMDLSQPERVIIPFLSFGIPIMAILVMGTTFIQSKLMTPPSTNPKDQSAMMGNMMNIYMPVLMGYMSLTMASGLSLYFLISNVVSVAQYAILGKVNWSNLLPKFGQAAETAALSSGTKPSNANLNKSSKNGKSKGKK